MRARAQAVLAAGGTVWVGDETTLRELPPLRCAWAKRGAQAIVVISGRNSRRVIHGAINVRTGAVVHLVRERSRQEDSIAFVTALGRPDPAVPKLLIWDNQPGLSRCRRLGCCRQSLARHLDHRTDPPHRRPYLHQVSVATYLVAPLLTESLRARRRGKAGLWWHADETYVKIHGVWCYLYRAIDADGNLVDSLLSENRNMDAAKRFFRQALRVVGRVPEKVTTDGHDAYPRAIREILGKDMVHRCSR